MSNELADQIISILNKYTIEVEEGLQEDIVDVTKEAESKLKGSSPTKTGKYAAGWGHTKQKNGMVLHNKKRAGLTHLLEKGHAKRNGGRTKAQVHIEPVEAWVQDEMVKRTERRLK